MRQTKTLAAKIKSADADTGAFSAVVAVFGNVDLHGDRIIPGAFAKTLERWRASGDPIPVVWSHQWHDLAAHVGHVDPAKARELEPGHPDLPESLADLGGLYVDGVLDVSEDGGRKVAKLLAGRRVNQFSFAYDVNAESEAEDGANELVELELFELGPTLLGANPATTLVNAKAADLAAALKSGAVDLEDLVDLGTELKAVLAAELAKLSDGNPPPADPPPADPPPAGKQQFSNPAAVAAIVALEREKLIP